MAKAKKAKRMIGLADVPLVPEDAPHMNGDGSHIFATDQERWRFNAEGRCVYYIKYRPGKGLADTPYEEAYRG